MSMERIIAEKLAHNRMHEAKNELPREYLLKANEYLNYHLGSYETGARVTGGEVISETPETVTLKVDYQVTVNIPIVDPEDHSVYTETEYEYRTQTITIDLVKK